MRWMNLEPITQSEDRKRKTNIVCILTHTCEIQKDGTDNLMCMPAKETHIKNRLWTQCEKEKMG